MPEDPLYSPRLKLERARQLKYDLIKLVEDYRESTTANFVRGPHPDESGKHIILIRTGPVPEEFYTLLGDCVHNYRVVLDHLVCCDYEKNSGGECRELFPFFKDHSSFSSKVDSKTSNLSSEGSKIVKDLSPYRGGNLVLWDLHHLDIVDKHRKIVFGLVQFGKIEGKFSVDMNFDIFSDYARDLREGIPFICLPEEATFEQNMKIAFDVTVMDSESFDQEPVKDLLHKIDSEVSRVMGIFEKHLFSP